MLAGLWKPEKLQTCMDVDSLMTYVGGHDLGSIFKSPSPSTETMEWPHSMNHSATPHCSQCTSLGSMLELQERKHAGIVKRF